MEKTIIQPRDTYATMLYYCCYIGILLLVGSTSLFMYIFLLRGPRQNHNACHGNRAFTRRSHEIVYITTNVAYFPIKLTAL